jgi:hypothetical protein
MEKENMNSRFVVQPMTHHINLFMPEEELREKENRLFIPLLISTVCKSKRK